MTSCSNNYFVDLLQKDDPKNPLSWFAMSAIHGYPNNLQWENAGPQVEKYGYCVHGDPRFPVWHRPYVALYEVSNATTSHIT